MSKAHASLPVIETTGPVTGGALAAVVRAESRPWATVTVPITDDPAAMREVLAGAVDEVAARIGSLAETSWAAAAVVRALAARLDRPLPTPADGAGLVLLAAPDHRAEFTVPTAVAASVHVGDLPHVLPLLPARRSGDRYAVLCISEECVRYFEGDRLRLRPVHVPELPAALGGIVWQEAPEETTFTCPAVRAARGAAVARTAPPEATPEHRERVRRFLRRVDYAVVAHLGTADPLPLVVVGAPDITARYTAASHYPWVVAVAQIDGWLCSTGVLHDHTWPAAAAHLRAPIEQALEDIRGLRGTGLVAEHPADAAAAAVEGGVAELVVAESWCGPRPMSADDATGDAVNAAVVHTWRHRGTVHVAPDAGLGRTGLLARLRY